MNERNEDYKKVVCPCCSRTVAYYLDGYNMLLQMKCQRPSCKIIFMVYSAGKTIEKDKLKKMYNGV